MPCRGVRGATTADSNTRDDVLAAAHQLLALMIRQNDIRPEDVASAIFSTTRDLNSEFPALAARQLGWLDVPLLCCHEMNVPGALEQCVRILVHWNTEKDQHAIKHAYIKGAERLRPDLANVPLADREEPEGWIAENTKKEK